MGPDCGLSQEMNWRVWSGLSPLITQHRDGAISRLGITSGVMFGVTSWPDKRSKTPCVNPPPFWVLNLYCNCKYQWSGIIFSFLTVPHPTQCTPMWEPLLWCNVQSAVLPGICGLAAWEGSLTTSVFRGAGYCEQPQGSDGAHSLCTVLPTLWAVSEPSDFMRFKYSDCWGVWSKYLSVIGLKYSWDHWTRDCHAVTAATRLGLIITVKCEPSNNNLPRRMIWWALHWLESYKSLEDRRFNAYQVWYFTGIGQGLNLSIWFCFF